MIFIKEVVRNLIVFKDLIKVSLFETFVTLYRKKSYRNKYLEARMLITAHALEKGMGLVNTRRGYGFENAVKLCEYIELYMKNLQDYSKYCLIESIGILGAYVDYQKNDGIDIKVIEDKYNFVIKKISNEQHQKLLNYKCGYVYLDNITLTQGRIVDFEKLISSRHSARCFSTKKIEKETIQEVVRLSNYAPTACNRQPIKIYCGLGEENAKAINDLLTGNRSFTDSVKNFAILTSERAYFTGKEQYQWYINGGIYLSHFVLALHSLGIGSCIMQWFSFSKNEKALKKLLGINKSEAIIAVVCLGYYPEQMKCICAQRMSPEEVVQFYESEKDHMKGIS